MFKAKIGGCGRYFKARVTGFGPRRASSSRDAARRRRAYDAQKATRITLFHALLKYTALGLELTPELLDATVLR